MTDAPAPPALLPRLSRYGVRRLLAAPELMHSSWRDRRSAAERWTTVPPLGGAVAGDATLDGLVADLTSLAASCGFPSRRDQQSAFDAEAAIHLVDRSPMRASDALRDDVWAFITTVLVPDIVRWRYGEQEERYQGGVRNVLQRLWLRARAVDRGPLAGETRWAVARALTEDAAVQIIERPGLAGAPRVSRALGERWLLDLQASGAAGLEGRMRQVARDMLVTNQVIRLELMPTDALDAEIDRLFRAAAAA